MTTEIYLDGNATSAVLPAALAAATDAMASRYGNPSSTHATGLQARALLDDVRQRAMRLLGAGSGRLMFNSGATEGIQSAVLSALCALRERQAGGEAIPPLLVYGATEHKAVPESLAHWNRLLGLNLSLTALPVDAEGRHDLAALAELAGRAALLCTMAANNETGVISDLAGIEATLTASGSKAYWLVDCVQALGKLDLNLSATRIDYAPFSGHKLYAPKGIGMLYLRNGAPFTPLIMGGGQEAGLRSGTENMAGIAALGAVLAALEQGGTFRSHAELAGFRDRLVEALRLALPDVIFNTPFAHALPTTLNFSVPGLASRELMDVFDAAQVRVSSGSACSAAKAMPSHVLDAMRLPDWRSSGAIRLSFGPLIDAATVAEACARIAHCGAALRAAGLIASGPTSTTHDGVVQLGVDGACSWLVLDAASRRCVVIDPLPALTERIASYVRCLDYRVAAILGTSSATPRALLAAALGSHFDHATLTDACGWPQSSASVLLQDERAADSLTLGARTLVRVPRGAGTSYLLGTAVDGQLPAHAVRYAFTAHAAQAGLHVLLAPDSLLCPSRDEHNQFCTSLRAQAATPHEADLQLDAGALEDFLRRHPQARLIDVREPHEHAATLAPALAGRIPHSVPLSRMAAQLSEWLRAEPVPLVFFCRSGARSLKAAQCLRRLGYTQAWTLRGGLALAPLALAA